MNKSIFAFILTITTLSVYVQAESKAFTLANATETLEIETPKHLAGVDKQYTGDARDITTIILRFIKIGAGLVGSLTVLFIVICCAMMVFSTGESDVISKAKKGLTWSIIGLVIIIFSFIIAKTVVQLSFVGQEGEEPSLEEREINNSLDNLK